MIPDPGNPTTPYRQKLGLYAGYFLAMTSFRAKKGDKYSTAYYVDSREFPYVVIPTGFTKPNGLGFWGQGDVGLATHVDTENPCRSSWPTTAGAAPRSLARAR